MENYAKNFVRAGIIYFFLSAILGLGMIHSYDWITNYAQIHVHLMLLGWMSMLIFGVGYHIIPRFQGHANISRGLANFHFILSNVGLILMTLGWWEPFTLKGDVWTWVLFSGGTLTIFGFLLFMIVIFKGLVPVKHD